MDFHIVKIYKDKVGEAGILLHIFETKQNKTKKKNTTTNKQKIQKKSKKQTTKKKAIVYFVQ
jgi:phage-related protein